MSPQELKTLILSDASATAFFNAKDDSACAARCMVIADPVRKKLQRSRLGLIDLYTKSIGLSGAVLANQVLDTIASVAVSNSLVAKVYAFTETGTHPDSLLDWGEEAVQAILLSSVNQGGCGLTQEQLAPLLQETFIPPAITPAQVELARIQG
jgi:hypothetical protein